MRGWAAHWSGGGRSTAGRCRYGEGTGAPHLPAVAILLLSGRRKHPASVVPELMALEWGSDLLSAGVSGRGGQEEASGRAVQPASLVLSSSLVIICFIL